MVLFKRREREFHGRLETGSKYRPNFNLKLGKNFPQQIILGQRSAKLAEYLINEFLRYGFYHLGFILIFKQKDFSVWAAQLEFIKKRVIEEMGEISRRLDTSIETNEFSVSIYTEAAVRSIFKKEGIELSSTYDFEKGEFVLLCLPFLYRDSKKEIVKVEIELGDRRISSSFFDGQREFVIGDEWFFNAWLPELFNMKFSIPLKFAFKDEPKLINIQEVGNHFEAVLQGVAVNVLKRKERRNWIYKVLYRSSGGELKYRISFRMPDEASTVFTDELLEKPFFDTNPSIYQDFSLKEEDLTFSYVLIPRPMGPISSFDTFIDPNGEFLKDQCPSCLEIHVDRDNMKIGNEEFKHFSEISVEFPVEGVLYKISVDKFCEKLWKLGNTYFLMEIEVPQKKGIYLNGNYALIGRDERNSFRLPFSERLEDFRNIHSSRFHALLLKNDDGLHSINLSTHFSIYIFKGKQVKIIPPMKAGERFYSNIGVIDFGNANLSIALEKLSLGGESPSSSLIFPGDILLIGNSVFRVSD